MKKVVLLAALAGLAVSCKSAGNQDSSGEKGLEGKWEIKRAEGMMSELNIGTLYHFEGNDKLTLSNSFITNKGTTEKTDSTFTFTAIGADENTQLNYKYHFVKDTLVVAVDGSDQIFFLVKK